MPPPRSALWTGQHKPWLHAGLSRPNPATASASDWQPETHCLVVAEGERPIALKVDAARGQVAFNWYAPELWRRFTITLRRRLAEQLGVPVPLHTAMYRLVKAREAP